MVVVDNDATASAQAVVERWSAESKAPTRYLRSRPRHKSAALNAGIRAAPTDWLAFTDDDTLPAADWLAQGARFAAAGGFRLFGGRIALGEIPLPLPRSLAPYNRLGQRPGGGVFVHYEPQPVSGALRPAAPVPFGANVFVHRTVFADYGGYDEALWDLCGRAALGVDDGEFGVRVKAAGEPLGYCHEAVVVHPVHTEKFQLTRRMRHAFHFGWRDALVFPDGPRRLRPFELRRLAGWAGSAVWQGLRGQPAEAAADCVEAARTAGKLAVRWSRAYAQRRAARESRV